MKKSERAGPHPIGQNGQLVKRSLGPQSQVPDPQSQITDPESQISHVRRKELGRIYFSEEKKFGSKLFFSEKKLVQKNVVRKKRG